MCVCVCVCVCGGGGGGGKPCETLHCQTKTPLRSTGLTKTHISAYITYKNLSVRKTMEAMRTAHAKSRTPISIRLKLHMRQITEGTRVLWKKACIVCEKRIIWLNRLMNLVVKAFLKCVIRFSISFWYAFRIFVPKYLVQLRTACTHLLKSATAGSRPTGVTNCVGRLRIPDGGPLSLVCTNKPFHQDIRISIPGDNKVLTLCEVSVFLDLEGRTSQPTLGKFVTRQT